MNFGHDYRDTGLQDFVWLGEYSDGSHLAEFDGETRKENKFFNIRKDCLIRFGLIGHGLSFYHEIFGGTFKLSGRMIDVIFKDRETGKEYYLTGQNKMYCDVITYKDAEALISVDGSIKQSNGITQYNFGYKISLDFDDGTNIKFKALCHIPNGAPVFLTFHMSCNRDFPKGVVIIKKNNRETEDIDVPFKKGVAGELNWFLR